jgi:hypothetical protein
VRYSLQVSRAAVVRLLCEWRELTGHAGHKVSAAETALRSVFATVLIAWVDYAEPSAALRGHGASVDNGPSVFD